MDGSAEGTRSRGLEPIVTENAFFRPGVPLFQETSRRYKGFDFILHHDGGPLNELEAGKSFERKEDTSFRVVPLRRYVEISFGGKGDR
jgi:hypothetical protein